MEQSEAVKNYLKSLGIEFKTHKHPAVYTVEEVRKYDQDVKGIHSKNLFMKNIKATKFFLVVLQADKRVDFKQMENMLNEKLKFANDKELKEILNLTPGSVSPFALLSDKEAKVSLIVDKDVWNSEFVSFHPCINTETLELKGDDFKKFVKSLKSKVLVVEL